MNLNGASFVDWHGGFPALQEESGVSAKRSGAAMCSVFVHCLTLRPEHLQVRAQKMAVPDGNELKLHRFTEAFSDDDDTRLSDLHMIIGGARSPYLVTSKV